MRPSGALSDAEWRHLAETSARPGVGGRVALHYDPAIAAPFRGAEPVDMDLSPIWTRVTAPVLLLRGAESDLLSAETARAMAQRPGVQLAEIPGCGHAPALMDPAADRAGLGFPVGRLSLRTHKNRRGARGEYLPPVPALPLPWSPSTPARPG